MEGCVGGTEGLVGHWKSLEHRKWPSQGLRAALGSPLDLNKQRGENLLRTAAMEKCGEVYEEFYYNYK